MVAYPTPVHARALGRHLERLASLSQRRVDYQTREFRRIDPVAVATVRRTVSPNRKGSRTSRAKKSARSLLVESGRLAPFWTSHTTPDILFQLNGRTSTMR
jgi:hypothetical protein